MMCEVYFCFWGKKNPNPNLEMCKEMRIHIEETRQTDRIKLIKKLCRFSSLSWTQLKYYGSLILEKKKVSLRLCWKYIMDTDNLSKF